jgi:outer membrane protein assembly factor BamB
MRSDARIKYWKIIVTVVLAALLIFSFTNLPLVSGVDTSSRAFAAQPTPTPSKKPTRPRDLTTLFLPLIARVKLYDWFQFNGDAKHSGNNSEETVLSADNVAMLQQTFRVALPDAGDGAPAYLSDVDTPSGAKDLLFITTKTGDLISIDATTGATVWIEQHRNSACSINNKPVLNGPCFTTSSPAIDPNRQFVYTYGLDGAVHKHRVEDGAEVFGDGWPQITTLKPWDEKGSSALSIATARDGTSYLYVTHASYPTDQGDSGDYQGHITAINLSDGTQQVFNAMCSEQAVHFSQDNPNCADTGSGIWARPGVVYDPDSDRIYATTGNGPFSPADHFWGSTVLALNPNGTGANGEPLDSFTPTDFAEKQLADDDMGSSSLAILPPLPNSIIPHLGLQGGKDRGLRLLNLDNLSGQGGPGKLGGEVGPVTVVPVGGEMHTTPAIWTNPIDNSTWVFASAWFGLAGFEVIVDTSGLPQLAERWTYGLGCTSPLVANDVLYCMGTNTINGAKTSTLFALDPLSGNALWQGNLISSIHWQTPIVANGVLYAMDGSGYLYAFSLQPPVQS